MKKHGRLQRTFWMHRRTHRLLHACTCTRGGTYTLQKP